MLEEHELCSLPHSVLGALGLSDLIGHGLEIPQTGASLQDGIPASSTLSLSPREHPDS